MEEWNPKEFVQTIEPRKAQEVVFLGISQDYSLKLTETVGTPIFFPSINDASSPSCKKIEFYYIEKVNLGGN